MVQTKSPLEEFMGTSEWQAALELLKRKRRRIWLITGKAPKKGLKSHELNIFIDGEGCRSEIKPLKKKEEVAARTLANATAILEEMKNFWERLGVPEIPELELVEE